MFRSQATPVSVVFEMNTALESVSPESSLENATLRYRFVRPGKDLTDLKRRWRALGERCEWRNPCFEPEMLLPAIAHGTQPGIEILVIELESNAQSASQLLGLMPIVFEPFYRLPLRCAAAWRPDELFDSTPLVDSKHKSAVFKTMLKALRNRRTRLLHFNTVSSANKFNGMVASVCQDLGLHCFQRDHFSRASLRPVGSIDEYSRRALSKNRRKKLSRATRKLQQQGHVEFEWSNGCKDGLQWAEDFLDLEASGWKGRSGSALASHTNTLKYFLELTENLISNDRLRMARLTLDQSPIAMLYDVQYGNHISAYKTAFDERYADFSPGAVLEWQNVQRLFQLGDVMVDSCTDPNNGLINGLYADRLEYQHLVIGLEPRMAPLINRVLPMIQRIGRKLGSVPKPRSSQVGRDNGVRSQ